MEKVDGSFEIVYDEHKFPTPDGMLEIKTGDSFIDSDANVIRILGYGVVDGGYTICLFFVLNDGDTFFVSVFEFRDKLLNSRVVLKRFNSARDNEFFNKRISSPSNVSDLCDFLSMLKGVTVKNDECLIDVRARNSYDIDNSIGYPDWFVKLKVTYPSGYPSLGAIATLTKDYRGKVFLFLISKYDSIEHKNSNSVFYTLTGVNVSPKQCIDSLSFLIDNSDKVWYDYKTLIKRQITKKGK
jgi:hypothetical protein